MKKFALTLLISALILAIIVPALSENIPLELNLASITIGVKQSVKTVKVTSGHTDIAWSSSDEKIAAVDETGKIKGVKKGTATITASSDGQSAEVTVTVVKKDKGVKKIKLNKKSVTLEAGKNTKLKATLTPAKPKDKTITWLSSDETIATVNSKGKVTAVTPGKATITAISSSGKSAKCEVTVTGVTVKKIKITGEKTMYVGDAQTLTVKITPENADDKSVSWKSSNEKIAEIDENGIVTAKKKGKVTITAAAKDGSKVKGTFAISVKNEDFPYDLYYEIKNGEVTVTSYQGDQRKLKIPAYIEGRPVTCIGNAFAYRNHNLEEVTIPEGVTVIGEEAFMFCDNLKFVSFPESLREIQVSAFYDCKSLNNVTLPSGITTLGGRVFQYCSSIEYIEIPAGLKTIDFYTFLGCTSLKNVKFNEGLLEIKLAAFTECDSLETIEFPASLQLMAREVMFGCDNLKTVIINEGVPFIEELSFAHCLKLEKVYIPSSVYAIASCAFVNYDTFENLPNLTIYGYTDTFAEKYANIFGFPFVAR